MTEYERLAALTRLLYDTAELLRVKGRTEAADVVHAEAIHFAAQRDIARAMADAQEELQTLITTRDLGEMPD